MKLLLLLLPVCFLSLAMMGSPNNAKTNDGLESYQSKNRTGKTFISVYMEPNCKGRATKIEVPSELASDAALKELGIKNDSIRSMKVPEGVTVSVFDGAGYKGDTAVFKTGEHNSLGNLDQRVSSLKATLSGAP
ncbi:beta/gamma crystallin-related protein [Roseimicrobium sp. ORNL1]|uniref:beta/gamma crystallin-related protein n=1 Tax=Roseimicrobium sp. ORNL1 TaxID=2711231 RepID=UPI0013E12230|nr:beta/gamma crystallin-related protein [Roseimicrobium sp. ORNL1]QIF01757.1 hypothetical protein G5S37_09545 [Roseimicrobium sp. ORNL1]